MGGSLKMGVARLCLMVPFVRMVFKRKPPFLGAPQKRHPDAGKVLFKDCSPPFLDALCGRPSFLHVHVTQFWSNRLTCCNDQAFRYRQTAATEDLLSWTSHCGRGHREPGRLHRREAATYGLMTPVGGRNPLRTTLKP